MHTRLFRSGLLLLVLTLLNPGSIRAQDTPSVQEPEIIEPVEVDSQLSGWSDEVTEIPAGEFPGELIVTTVPGIPVEAPPVDVYTDGVQQIPVLRVEGRYFDPSGLSAMGPMSTESNQAIRSRMARTLEMGYRCFLLRVDWPAVAPEPNRLDDARVRELLQYADELGLKVIISLELNRAPAWFFRGEGGSGRLMVSRLEDPEQERTIGNDGDLRWSNGTGVPLYYHPDTLGAMENLVFSLHNSLKDEPALMGWYLSGPVTLAYPGGGRDGVVGMCDYSPFTVSRYYEYSGMLSVVYPLHRYSQGTWDRRPEFRVFAGLRLTWKREAFDRLVGAFAEVGSEQLILVGMDPVLNYRNDNGYLNMVQAPDATRQLLHEGVDGAVIDFRISSDSFNATNARSECSAMHLSLTINQVVRNGRLAIVLIEPDTVNPPSPNDIAHIAYMTKAAGAYSIWCSGFIQRRGHRWSWAEEVAIERTQPITLLPPPKRLRQGNVGIFDVPGLCSSFYAEQNASLPLALTQLTINQRAGIITEVISTGELSMPAPVLNRYTDIIYLVPELEYQESAIGWLSPTAQIELARFREIGGNIRSVNQLLLRQYELEDYHSQEIEDRERTHFVSHGAAADLLNGADAFIVANDPYIFVRINRLHGSRWIDVKLVGWPETNLARIDLIELPSGDPVRADLVSNSASFKFGPTLNSAHFYIVTDDYVPVARIFEARQVGVAISQQTRNMRRSVPAALLLASLLAVTLIWMTFQSQQRSLLQAAELVDRSRRIEPIDILDQPEVKEFYEKYISGPGETDSTDSRER